VIEPVHGRAILPVLIVVALVVRLVAAEFVLSKGRTFLPDSELYWGYAESIAKNGAYQVGGAGARRTPGYPLFIVGCTKLIGTANPVVPPPVLQLRAVLLAQAILGALVVWMIASLGASIFTAEPVFRNAATFAAFFAALDPFSIPIGAMILSETLFTAALVTSVWCGAKALVADRNRIGWIIGAAVSAGVAVLARPSGLLLAPIGLAAMATRWGFRNSLIAVVAFGAILAPWVVRNASLYQRFIPTTLNVGESLYDGWNPEADGGSNMAFADRRKLAHGGARNPADEIAEDAFWKQHAIEWAKEHPSRVLHLALVKIARFWSPWPNALEFQSTPVVAGCGIFSLAAFGGAIIGVIVLASRRRWNAVLLALTPAVYFMALHAVFVSSVRYRVPAMPMLELATGVGLAWLLNQRTNATRRAGDVSPQRD
jgi:4-amino-4-deoxy-L-arabinose transferase-like glycosyltransferase